MIVIVIAPKSFKYAGRTYTPRSFLKNVTKLEPNDYVDFMSLIQKPYWSQEEYKVPDNWWRSDEYYNIPLDEFMTAIKDAIKIFDKVMEIDLNAEVLCNKGISLAALERRSPSLSLCHAGF